MKRQETYDKIFNITASVRQCGYTTAMLKAAMYEPDCIIISNSKETARYLEQRYDELYGLTFNPKNPFKRLTIKLHRWLGILEKPTKKPMFRSINQELRGYHKPFFFDNSCFLS